MSQLDVIDTFPAFRRFWRTAQRLPLAEQIEAWAGDYMSAYPELFEKQVQDYAEQSLDWKEVALEKVFPHLQGRLPVMQEARNNLLEIAAAIYIKALQVVGFESEVCFVIYVGLGCGAGWVTTYQGRPAILFGLENIAESGWSDMDAIRGLVSHEIGHVAHYSWRAQMDKPPGQGAWWQLYEEGFAQHCETLIQGEQAMHQAAAQDDWLAWCQSHKRWLAAEFLRSVDHGEPVNRFFGSWLAIEGRSETGYFLGAEVIQALERKHTLKEIALLENVETPVRAILEEIRALPAEGEHVES